MVICMGDSQEGGAERKQKNYACISPFPLEKQDDNEAVATMRRSMNRTKKGGGGGEKTNPELSSPK